MNRRNFNALIASAFAGVVTGAPLTDEGVMEHALRDIRNGRSRPIAPLQEVVDGLSQDGPIACVNCRCTVVKISGICRVRSKLVL